MIHSSSSGNSTREITYFIVISQKIFHQDEICSQSQPVRAVWLFVQFEYIVGDLIQRKTRTLRSLFFGCSCARKDLAKNHHRMSWMKCEEEDKWRKTLAIVMISVMHYFYVNSCNKKHLLEGYLVKAGPPEGKWVSEERTIGCRMRKWFIHLNHDN